MSDVELSGDSEDESSQWETDVSISDSDATVSNVLESGTDLSDDDQDLFLDFDEGTTNSSSGAHVQVDVASMSDLEDFDDSDSSSVQVLSEAEQLDVSSVVEVWTDRGDEPPDENDDDRSVSPDAHSEPDNSDTEVEENDEPQAEAAVTVVSSEQQPQQQQAVQPVPAHERSVSDEEGTTCTICFEAWTASGTHRLASLKCGHLYGLSCIERWVKGQRAKCPPVQCPSQES
ncbi:hypothetical protein MTO96_007492 [Rhipicephalus appendiculatus]